jgi:hypothetical protein
MAGGSAVAVALPTRPWMATSAHAAVAVRRVRRRTAGAATVPSITSSVAIPTEAAITRWRYSSMARSSKGGSRRPWQSGQSPPQPNSPRPPAPSFARWTAPPSTMSKKVPTAESTARRKSRVMSEASAIGDERSDGSRIGDVRRCRTHSCSAICYSTPVAAALGTIGCQSNARHHNHALAGVSPRLAETGTVSADILTIIVLTNVYE